MSNFKVKYLQSVCGEDEYIDENKKIQIYDNIKKEYF